MTGFEPRGREQLAVVRSGAPLTVVLGGAGTGKTVSALAAARAHLERAGADPLERVLVLSFSRASVARIIERSRRVLGEAGDRVEIHTFHGLAWSVVRRFGALFGHPDPVLANPARQKLKIERDSLGYNDIIPLAVRIITSSAAVREHLHARWTLVIVDEFQDTDNAQAEFVDAVAGDARRILLGDPDQCIYTFRADDGVRLARITDASATAGPDNTIEFADVSHRDPTQVIPAVARAIQRREFGSEAIAAALQAGRLEVRTQVPLADEVSVVADTIEELRDQGLEVAVFTHHNDMLAALSDGLESREIEHELAGLSDALTCGLDAQVAMLRFAASVGSWDDVLESLAIFVTSAGRGKAVPQLAHDIAAGGRSPALAGLIEGLGATLSTAAPDLAFDAAMNAHTTIGLPNKSSSWTQAARIIRSLRARARRRLGPGASERLVVTSLAAEVREVAHSALTQELSRAHPVQLMNLYQTKGREADATVVVLREGDFLGNEREPFPDTSRLLYVVFSRARQRIIIIPVGTRLHPAVAPLARLTAAHLASS